MTTNRKIYCSFLEDGADVDICRPRVGVATSINCHAEELFGDEVSGNEFLPVALLDSSLHSE
ncbi:MAG: hypothetical protein IIB00_04090 [candidate division Zixibacteria bacterium]|nr:hypothetical protein [candidate division Zixibacteria bacterium]